MNKTIWLWVVALLATLVVGRHQRASGPTHPISGEVALETATFPYTLERTHAGAGDQRVVLKPGDPMVHGVLEWRPVGTADETWRREPMTVEGETLVGTLPHQEPAGKLAYQVTLTRGTATATLPPQGPAVIRFRGDVPPLVLIPHILFMMAAMLFSTRAGLEVLNPQPRFRWFTHWTLALLFVGGFVLGPLVSANAFGVQNAWGGWPVSNDVTDNKTLIALVAWLIAAFMVHRSLAPRLAVVGAALVMIAVFIIPHSVSAKDLYGGGRPPEPPPAAAPAVPAPAAPDSQPQG